MTAPASLAATPAANRAGPSQIRSVIIAMANAQQGFLQDKLDKALAVRADQRSPEVSTMRAAVQRVQLDSSAEPALAPPRFIAPSQVAALVECCQLQRKVAELLARPPTLPGVAQCATLAYLKLVRSHFLSPANPLAYKESVIYWARRELTEAAEAAAPRAQSFDEQLDCFLRSDTSLSAVLTAAVGLPAMYDSRTGTYHGRLRAALGLAERVINAAPAHRWVWSWGCCKLHCSCRGRCSRWRSCRRTSFWWRSGCLGT